MSLHEEVRQGGPARRAVELLQHVRKARGGKPEHLQHRLLLVYLVGWLAGRMPVGLPLDMYP
jgi:hypothetical protein